MAQTVIAVAGKGGVGKTSISAAIVRQLVKDHPHSRILAIDADPAVGLETSLGVKAASTVDEIRKVIVEAGKHDKSKRSAIELLGESRFRLLEAMLETDGFAFLAIGRPEAAGCYCAINAYLREVISTVAGGFDYVVIDGEAGVEQINRRVMEKVTHLLLVTDASKKGTQVVQTIQKVAEELMMYQKCGVIINRMAEPDLRQFMELGTLEVLASIGDDPRLAMSDIRGQSVLELPENCALVRGVQEALRSIGIESKNEVKR